MVGTLHMWLDFLVTKSSLVPSNSTARPANTPKQKEAASNTGTIQNGRKFQTYNPYTMQTWVFRIAHGKWHRPPPLHVGTFGTDVERCGSV